jgi:hypothetical protein
VLVTAAIDTVRNWGFKPQNVQREFVPVVVDVAVSFQLDALQSTQASTKKSER